MKLGLSFFIFFMKSDILEKYFVFREIVFFRVIVYRCESV